MTASASTTTAPSWTVPAPSRGAVSRIVAAALHASAGLVVASASLGFAVAGAIIDRGVVVASSADVATLHALAPLAALFAVVGAAHVVAAFGIVFGSRNAAGLGIGLGAFDAVAGVVALVVAATSARGQVDGVGIGMTFVLAGIVLAVAARAADWNTHGQAEA